LCRALTPPSLHLTVCVPSDSFIWSTSFTITQMLPTPRLLYILLNPVTKILNIPEIIDPCHSPRLNLHFPPPVTVILVQGFIGCPVALARSCRLIPGLTLFLFPLPLPLKHAGGHHILTVSENSFPFSPWLSISFFHHFS
jgi:hypothetical protein